MKVKVFFTGKTTEDYLREGIGIYAGRLRHYTSFELVELPDLRQASSLSAEQVKQKEGEILLKSVRTGDHLVLLDERGTELSSVEWARNLEQKAAHLPKDLVFVIGGPYGFSPSVYSRADERLSLSRMTMSHQLVRLVFLEQLYRAFTIIRGEPYHHE
ncbi:MAG: 23S rRNA (pseudouridine(1915)-N(3))-methyltransferase RlmH [Bacteroidales bacterium]|nr:23S rRNA (pseudouridine(1915)-N(3))-methyltransferase RlmH [Bacteroidales bacterium]